MDRQMLSQLRRKYSNIVAVFPVDSHSGNGVDALRSFILQEALTQATTKKIVPIRLSQSIDRLNRFADDNKEVFSVSLPKIHQILSIENLGTNDTDDLLQQLISSETIRKLSNDEIVLRPHQVADVLACVVTKNPKTLERVSRLSRAGILKHSVEALGAVWGQYDQRLWLCEQRKLSPFLELLYDSGLAYEVFDVFGRSRGKSIIPCILQEEPEGFKGDVNSEEELLDHFFGVVPSDGGSLSEQKGLEKLQIDFNFLPFTFFAQLLAALRTMATDGGAWRSGAVLSAGVSFALVTEKRNSIVISLRGTNRSVRSVVLFRLLEVLKKFRSMVISEISLTRNGRKWSNDDIEEAILHGNGYLFSQKKESLKVEVNSLRMLFLQTQMLRCNCSRGQLKLLERLNGRQISWC